MRIIPQETLDLEASGYRICNHCHVLKPLDEYYRNSCCRMGRIHRCIPCQSIVTRARYPFRKEAHRRSTKKWAEKNPEKCREISREYSRRKAAELRATRPPKVIVPKVKLSSYPEYSSWAGMRSRCLNPKTEHYSYYGGRGIKVCAEWLQSFYTFLADMGPKPGPTYSIDRIDPDGDYTPSNCRWATKREQMLNRRPRKIVDRLLSIL